ncbi:MAG: hypothetical protein KC516_02835 [Nanoarchaeota archaeon]|nr:hypothetical protein [Nanoarchaeota archaeon]
MAKRFFTIKEAESVGKRLGIKWNKFDPEQFRIGMGVELEHGKSSKKTDVTKDDSLKTGKIALAHLNEFPDYYTRLLKMEEKAERFWKKKKIKKHKTPKKIIRLAKKEGLQ